MSFRRRRDQLVAGPTFDPDYLLFILLAIGLGFPLPDPPTQQKQSTLFTDLKSIGAWPLIDGLWLPATQNSNLGRINLKNLAAPLAALVNAPSHVSNQGWAGNGINSYINLNWNPAVNGVNYQLNNCSLLVASNSNQTGTDRIAGANGAGSANLQIAPRLATNTMSASINQSAFTNGGAVTNSSGLFHLKRTASNSVTAYRNGVAVYVMGGVSNARPNANLYAGAVNNNGVPINFSTRNIGLVAVGASLTGMEAAISTAWNNYITGL